MKKIKWPVLLATAFASFYHVAPLVGVSDNTMFTLFAISPFVVLWLVYQVLKNGEASKKTFDEYFYEDYAYRRNVPGIAAENEGDML